MHQAWVPHHDTLPTQAPKHFNLTTPSQIQCHKYRQIQIQAFVFSDNRFCISWLSPISTYRFLIDNRFRFIFPCLSFQTRHNFQATFALSTTLHNFHFQLSSLLFELSFLFFLLLHSLPFDSFYFSFAQLILPLHFFPSFHCKIIFNFWIVFFCSIEFLCDSKSRHRDPCSKDFREVTHRLLYVKVCWKFSNSANYNLGLHKKISCNCFFLRRRRSELLLLVLQYLKHGNLSKKTLIANRLPTATRAWCAPSLSTASRHGLSDRLSQSFWIFVFVIDDDDVDDAKVSMIEEPPLKCQGLSCRCPFLPLNWPPWCWMVYCCSAKHWWLANARVPRMSQFLIIWCRKGGFAMLEKLQLRMEAGRFRAMIFNHLLGLNFCEMKMKGLGTTASFVEVCPYVFVPLGYRDPYVGILVPTCNPLLEGTLGNLVLVCTIGRGSPVASSCQNSFFFWREDLFSTTRKNTTQESVLCPTIRKNPIPLGYPRDPYPMTSIPIDHPVGW